MTPPGLSAADPDPRETVDTAIDLYGSRNDPLFFGVKAANAGLKAAGQGDTTGGQFVGAAADGIALGESFADVAGQGGLVQVAQIYVAQGFIIYDLVASGKLSELMDGIFGGFIDKTPYWNGFRLAINPTGRGNVAAVLDFDARQSPAPAYDANTGSFNGEATIPSHVRGLGPTILPVGVMLGIASKDTFSLKIRSLVLGSELFYFSANALDIDTLTNITASSQYYRSLDGVLFNASQTELVRYPIAKGGGVMSFPPA